jgi:hypothetical protein
MVIHFFGAKLQKIFHIFAISFPKITITLYFSPVFMAIHGLFAPIRVQGDK